MRMKFWLKKRITDPVWVKNGNKCSHGEACPCLDCAWNYREEWHPAMGPRPSIFSLLSMFLLMK